MTDSFNDIPATLDVSNYKWLTDTLKTAQLQSAMTPFYKVRIVDDTIQPLAIDTPPGVPLFGQAVNAPDGTMLVTGNDGTGKLAFWKITDPDNPSQWTTPIVLDVLYLTQFNASIAVSEYISGSYSIDIYYAKNVAGSINIINQHSDDGGLSWSSSVATVAPGISSATSDNFCIAAIRPTLNFDNTISRMFFYIKNNSVSYDIFYQHYSGSGGTFSSPVIWTNKVNSQDLIIHSIDAFLGQDNIYHLVISAYHLYIDTIVNQNFGIYTADLLNMTNGLHDNWSILKTVFSNPSTSTQNMNVFTFPRITYDGSFYRLLFQAVIVNSVQQSRIFDSGDSNVGTITYYYLSQSKDFKTFSYPAPLLFTDGTIFNSDLFYSFVPFGDSNYYVVGNGLLWKYVKNNIVADVTNSVISYNILEEAGSASSVEITIGNQNNQWYGSSPSKPGAAAIVRNRKIYIDQGYVNANKVGETVPHDIFYIDDIQQNVTATLNELVISGRNLVKLFKVLTTKFAYNYPGIKYYNDIFDGTTLPDWNQVTGSWVEINRSIQSTDSTVPNPTLAHQVEDPNNTNEAIYCLWTQFPDASVDGRHMYIYPYYQDNNNNLQFDFYTVATEILLTVTVIDNGVTNVIVSAQNLGSVYSNKTLPILFHRYDYLNYFVVIGSTYFLLDSVYQFDPNTPPSGIPPTLLAISGFDVNVGGTAKVRNGIFAMGVAGYSGNFQLFRHIEYLDSQSMQDLMQELGVLSGVFDYDITYSLNDTLFKQSDYNSNVPYLNKNGFIEIDPSTTVLNNTYNISNGEIEFRARLLPVDPTVDMSASLLFRTSSKVPSFDNGYLFNLRNSVNNSVAGIFSSARFQFRSTQEAPPTDFLLSTSSGSVDYSGATPFLNNLNVDLTQWHTYRLVTFNNWMFGFIDEELAIAWFDDHVSLFNDAGSRETGGIGFETDANTILEVQYIRSRILWTQIQNFSLNPGDDASNSLINLLTTLRAWSYSNLLGEMTTKILDPNEDPTYTYNNQTISQSVDDSDKEYVNQVTVYGVNVSAVYQDTNSIATTGKIRDLTIIDYKITTYADALTRAQYELVNANKFINQNTPNYPNNVGAEVFDVVTIINTGNNSVNVSNNFRVYNQEIKNDGSKGFYGIRVETGSL